MLSELHHPAIVRLIGTSTNDSTGRLLIVTERCDMDLKEFINSQPQCVGRRDFETWQNPANRPSFHEAILMLEDIWSDFGDGYDQC